MNILRYGATTVTVITLVASGFVYTWSTLQSNRKTPTLTIALFSSYGFTYYLNSGPGSIFVERVDLNCDTTEGVLKVGELIAEGAMLKHWLGAEFKPNSVIPVTSDQQWEDLVAGRVSQAIQVYLRADDPTIAMLRTRMGSRFRETRGEATIVWYALRDGHRRKESISLVGYFVMPNPLKRAEVDGQADRQ